MKINKLNLINKMKFKIRNKNKIKKKKFKRILLNLVNIWIRWVLNQIKIINNNLNYLNYFNIKLNLLIWNKIKKKSQFKIMY